MLRSQLNESLGPDMNTGEGGGDGRPEDKDKDGSPRRRAASKSPSKARSLSDGGPPILSPSPKFREPEKRKSKDDSAIEGSPTTPRRPAFPRGLSLQMPARDLMSPSTSAAYRVPLSPKLDHSQTYGSPTSVLPRRSRGLEFSRSATHLHNSTLAESSPDSSPTITGRAMNIPNRKNGLHFSGGLDSNNINSSSLWSTMGNADRMTVSSSLGSVNMMMSESSSSSSDDDVLMDADDIDDSILSTPQVNKMSGPFGGPQPSPGTGWVGQSPAVNSLMSFARLRHQKGKSRKSSSSGSGNSMVSPSSKSPPTTRNVDGINGYFGREMTSEAMHNRRESISWAANQLHISGGSESDDGTLKSTLEHVDGMSPKVIRRAVTRRGNMLPKTKGFARIRAALAEESAPVETEFRREAEVVRLTRESDMESEPRHHSVSNTTTTHSSPTMGPTTQDSLEGIPEDETMTDLSQGLSSSFKQHAMKNSKGKDFWETFKDDSNRTPPPPQFLPRGSSSGISDISLDSPSLSNPPVFPSMSNTSDHAPSSPSRSSTPQPQTGPTREEITRKVNNKRRRDDDFDPTSFKRRAVSPGMSVHNSPIMQSPMQRDLQPWGSRPPSNGDGKQANGGPKRVGFQGMVDTNDGLMKMSIE
ncbi:hypothetical protein IFR04_014282 [Cadophora malorum]|uniref:Uncharacterized protein n=1 Tax=Cadophora malorum TaxID=108018 RepID=A0A8H7SZU3_9HELO|nr:hypothetical protein IFR04_014282 [Cadophora malorum]